MKIVVALAVGILIGVAVTSAAASSHVVFADHDTVAAKLAKGGEITSSATYKVSGSHRDKGGQVEVHDKETDIVYVVEGSATFLTGGTMVGGKDTGPGQHLGTDMQGGETHQLTKGDVIVVPAGVAHWFKTVPDHVNYFVVKVIQP